MAVKAARRYPERASVPVYKRLSGGNQVNNIVCKYWLAGRCSRNPCTFMHTESALPQPKQSHLTWKNPNCHSSKSMFSGGKIAQETQKKRLKSEVAGSVNTPVGGKIAEETQQKLLKSEVAGSGNSNFQKTKQQKLCKYWVTGNCVHGDKCQNLHSWFYGNGFSLLARLEGHTKAVTGIALPSGSDKLYSGSKDKSLRIWDCNSGQCAGVVDLDIECGTLISEGPWLFAGFPNAAKAWNLQTQSELTLQGPVGQVYAIAEFNDMLFAGAEDGTILAWKFASETSYELVASLRGHSGAVLSLVVGANRLYSGSTDHTIRVWDLESLQCMHTLNGHTKDVTSVLCWDSYLLSGSLDNKIKVWAATESGNLEVVFERNEDDGVLALCGICDAEVKPILLCSCKDNTVRLYDLPTFIERGRIFSKREVQVIQTGTGGLFFTGDATGQLSVWKLHREPSSDPLTNS